MNDPDAAQPLPSDEIKQLILEIVQDKQGCKVTELLVELARRVQSYLKLLSLLEQTKAGGLTQMVDELVAKDQLIAIEYKLASMPYKTKTFLLPAGTQISYERP